MQTPRFSILAGVTTALTASVVNAALVASDATLVKTTKVWSSAPHNSFTDLSYYNGAFYMVFREASEHVVPPAGTQGGIIRILRSTTGASWSSVGSFDFGINNDLRDPKINVTPSGQLMVLASDSPQAGGTRQSYTWLSSDGTNWSAGAPNVPAGQWLWRAEWNGPTAYGISYSNNLTRLYKSSDGVHYTTIVPTLTSGNEAAILFEPDGTAVTLVRRDGTGAADVVGTSRGDYTNWSFVNTNRFVGGPDMIQLPDGRIVVGGRLTDGTERTSLMFLNPATGALDEFMTLPSSGDSSYPGFVWKNNTLWVSYYASQSGKASIYLSQVTFANLPEAGSALALAAVVAETGRRRRSKPE